MSPFLVALSGLGFACLLLLMLPLVGLMRRQERTAVRLAAVQRRAMLGDRPRRGAAHGATVTLIARLGEILARGLLSARTVQDVQVMLDSLGFRGRRAVGVFIGTKVLLFVALPLLGYFGSGLLGHAAQGRLLAGAIGAILGLLLPEMVVRHLRGRYLKQVERGIADGLDMIVICSEAGLGLETAIQRTAHEIRPAWPALGQEMALVASELRVLSDRRAALQGMGERTQLEPLRRLARVMIQSQQYGTPLTQALRTLAAELRQEQLIAFEARAAKLPVLLTMPMILFILPTVFLVVAGPALLAVAKYL